MRGEIMPAVIPFAHRSVLAVRGPDRKTFLQGLVTNDMTQVNAETALYACLLTSNGRFLHDFLVFEQDETLLLTPERARADDLYRLLRRYVLRSKVELLDLAAAWAVWGICGADTGAALGFAAEAEAEQAQGEGTSQSQSQRLGQGRAQALADGVVCLDPRDSRLGAVAVLPQGSQALAHLPQGDFSIWDSLRIGIGIPDGSRDLIPERAILLENNIDRLHGISWTKGCYMGQELTARTHYRGLVRKGLVPVRVSPGTAPAFDAPLFKDGAEVGHMRSVCGDAGLALVRLEEVGAGDVLRGAEDGIMRILEIKESLH